MKNIYKTNKLLKTPPKILYKKMDYNRKKAQIQAKTFSMILNYTKKNSIKSYKYARDKIL